MIKIIAHLDMDAFFAAIEERENPQFAGLGIVVGADPKNGKGRGVVSTADYQARKYGIHSAQPISTAWRLAQQALKQGNPKIIFLPVNISYYHQVSEKIMGILKTYIPVVEQTSIDEAYLDLSFSFSRREGYKEAVNLVRKIKEEIRKKERLTASVGLGSNKLMAKIASGREKPDGLTVVLPQEREKFLDPLPIGEIPGIGPKTEEKLHQLKIFKIAELKNLSQEKLREMFGKWGEDIYQKARGVDESPLEVKREAKSISEQETFAEDSLRSSFLLPKLEQLVERVYQRMQEEKIAAFKTVTLMVRFFDFTTKTRAHTLADYKNDETTLKKETLKLFLPFLDKRENPRGKLIRLVGVGIENFMGKKRRIERNTKLF